MVAFLELILDHSSRIKLVLPSSSRISLLAEVWRLVGCAQVEGICRALLPADAQYMRVGDAEAGEGWEAMLERCPELARSAQVGERLIGGALY